MKNQHSGSGFFLRFTAFLTAFVLLTVAFAVPAFLAKKVVFSSAEAVSGEAEPTVILDAGHGGEDGGAVSADGVYEKDINLSIVLFLKDLLEANGIRTVLTRSDDRLLYDPQSDYHGRKKVQDLQTRREIAESYENPIFVSVHMNAFPQSKYSGLQVWYSGNHKDGKLLAQSIQNLAKASIQPENDRKVKLAGSSIYLLYHLQCPAVLAECGFLSNPAEAERLNTTEYQQKIAFLLFLSILSYLQNTTSSA